MARKANVTLWEKHIADQKSSDLSQVKWCEQNKISIHTFRYWVNHLRNIKTADTQWAAVSVEVNQIN